MIKIPATAEGLPAIREVISMGINVNITLIFSTEVYRKVADAYIEGLEARLQAGQDISTIASVASFFVSRVDAICEKCFDGLVKAGKAKAEDQALFAGKVGIANSKLAYEEFEKIFNSPRFKTLLAKKARRQRPLWASTGTKNPKLSPVLYVEELAGRDTVDTMPPATLKALMEKARIEPRLHAGLDESKALIAKVQTLGVPVPKLLVDLQIEGVKLFADSYKELVDSVEQKRSVVSQVGA
jgi:transaldolase